MRKLDISTVKTILSVSVLLLFVFFSSCQRNRDNQKPRTIVLNKGWYIQNSKLVKVDLQQILKPDLNVRDWYKAKVPNTVLNVLVENEVYKNPYFGKNLLKIPTKQFENPWWYRTEFNIDDSFTYKNGTLCFDGINYRANIWLNGKQLASADTLFGSFRHFHYNVTSILNNGRNTLAVEIFPPKPGDFTIGFVDWNPRPPDNNMGLWRPVYLHFSGPVSINNTFVQSKVNTETLNDAALFITTQITNHTSSRIKGQLIGQIGNLRFEQEVSLSPHESRIEKIDPQEHDVLNIKNPRLWWPNNLGKANLYKLKLAFIAGGKESDVEEVTFGIREIVDYFNEEGYRGYKINGKPILIKGGGWVDDLLLADTPEKLEAQVKYAKHINLNTLRLEGFWGTDQKLYDLCDKYGILLMVGWSCHWEWEEYVGKACDDFGGIKTEEEMDLISKSWHDQITMLRNHPSIFVWMGGSDKLPRPALEKRYLDILKKTDGSRPYLGSAGGATSEVSGPTGVKMNGPYAYTPPVYWYEDNEHGGAFGFNTETGPGPQVPPLESIKKMIPEDHLWPIDHYWEYHCGRNNFNTLQRFVKAMDERYGKVDNVEQFAMVSQVMNYELIRPMFEAFAVNNGKTTGIIQWMFNSAWPEMYWQLFDSYLMPNGAFYGVKKAAYPLHLIYNYSDKSIYAVNGYFKKFGDLKADIKVYDINSNEVWNEAITFEIGENTAKKILPYSVMKSTGLVDLSDTYFLSLKLLDSERKEVSNNFYWLSKKSDIPDYQKTEWYYTPIKQYADFKLLHQLPQVNIEAVCEFEENQVEKTAHVTLKNPTENIAFFIELKIVGHKSGLSVLPIFWDDNYISLLPREKREIKARFSKKDLKGEEPIFKYSGWNVTIN